jgi:hypothetical protein
VAGAGDISVFVSIVVAVEFVPAHGGAAPGGGV